jgi:hypothetical protein
MIDWLNNLILVLVCAALIYVTVYAALIGWIMYIHS